MDLFYTADLDISNISEDTFATPELTPSEFDELCRKYHILPAKQYSHNASVTKLGSGPETLLQPVSLSQQLSSMAATSTSYNSTVTTTRMCSKFHESNREVVNTTPGA